MNKTFKLVFSKARNTLMVVNEATKSTQTKGCRTVIAAAMLSAIMATPAVAAGLGGAGVSIGGESGYILWEDAASAITVTEGQAGDLTIKANEFTSSGNYGAITNSVGGSVAEINLAEGSEFTGNASNRAGAAITIFQAGKHESGSTDNVITGATFSKNITTTKGGAVASMLESTTSKISGSTTFVDSTFKKNTVTEGDGGAIYAERTSIIVNGGSFTENTAGQNGGAIHSHIGSLTVDGAIFQKNKAGKNGGAIYADYDFKVSSSKFEDNESSGHGGAIFAKRSFEITDATFKHNLSTKDGGAIAFDNYGFRDTNGDFQGWKEEDGVSRAITKSEFVINEAANGGAVAVKVERDFYAVPTMFDEVTFTDNSATGKGGAILAEDDITVKNSTFGGNSADKGGALFVDLAANVTLQDVVFTSNKAETSGGAIFVETGSSVTFTGDATFVANTVGGVLNDIHNDGQVVVNAGTLTLDGGITGNGTLTFADGSSLNVKLGSSQTDSTTISNAISVGENVGLSMTFNPGYVGEYQLLGESGSLDGEFVVTENTVYNITAVEDEAGTYSIELKSAGEIAQSTGADSNQASALNAVMSDSSSHEIFNQIATAISDGIQSTDPAVRQAALDAVTAMSPEVAPMVTQVQSDTATQVFGLIGNRLGGSAQGMASGDGTSGTALWVQGMVGTTDLDDTSKARGYSADTTGMAMGLEAKPTDAFTVGAGFAYADTEVDGFLRKTDVESMTAFLYGEYKPSNWFVNGIVSYAWANYEEAKSVAGIGVDAEYDADTFGVQLMTGLDLAVANFSVTPEVGLRYFHIGTDAYTDTAGTSVGDSDEDVLTGVLGARLSTAIEMSKAVRFVPEARVAMTYDFVDADNSSFVTLANGSSYSVEGETLDRFGVEAGVGVKAEMGDNFEMSLSYEGACRGDYENHAGILNAKYKF